MTETQQEALSSEAAGPVKTVAAIDIGANAVRMVIAEVSGNGSIKTLEQLQRAVRLGQDTFRRERLSRPSIRSAAAILRDFQRLMDFYKVEQVRAVATSAVREANNSDTLLDRIFMATGLDVEVIATSEESRLTVSAVRQALDHTPAQEHIHTLIASVGGGSTLLTILEKGDILESHSLRLGSVRLQEMLSTAHEQPEEAAEILQQQITNEIAVVRMSPPLKKMKRFIAVGGDARFAARQIGKPIKSTDLFAISKENYNKLVKKCRRHAAEELVKKYGIPFEDAEILNPALLIYKLLLRATRAPEMVVSQVTMRDGLLLDLAQRVTGQEDEAITKGVIHSAEGLAEKYGVELAHARNVAALADQLFTGLQNEHGLGHRHRLLLQAAALTHEVGSYISNRAHHKHSYYVILNSEIFGLTRFELAIVAHVARYHRRNSPRPSHLDFMNLPREQRTIISKLASLLRVADALDASHTQQIRQLRCERREETLVIYLNPIVDLSMKRRQMASKGDLFEDLFGLKIRLEEDAVVT